MEQKYLFRSERLGFRNWIESDVPKMAAISGDPLVMEFFPAVQDISHTQGFVDGMKEQFSRNGFCYFAVDKLENNEFIGFIGIAEQTYKADFTPCVDIGWRLSQQAWGKGYATEGANRCLQFAFETIGLTNVKSICPKVNVKSARVMEKIGMRKSCFFQALVTR